MKAQLTQCKLGYGGTKQEMERLLADAEKLTGIEYNIDNLGDVYEAIHVIQGELGLTGVAAQEASTTFSGSFNAMKAAAQNFLGSLAIGENVNESLNTLMSSVSTFFFGNFIPMLGTIIKALPGAITTFLAQGIPTLLAGVSSLVTSFAQSIATLANGLTSEKVATWVTTTLPQILTAAGSVIGKFVQGLLQNLPKIVAIIAKIGLTIVTGLGSAIWAKVTAAAQGIASRFMAPITALISKASATAASIKNSFMSHIESMKEKVRSILDRIKGFFPISIGKVISGLKLPHFSISGKFSLNPPSVPKFSVSWYAKGGIIDGPAVFGGIGLGEAGPEAILPLNPFWDKLDKIAKEAQTADNITINVYASEGMDVAQLAKEVEQRLVLLQKQRVKAWGY